MKKINPEIKDLDFAKHFINSPEPDFIRKLSLEMDVDYLCGLCSRFLEKDSYLENILEPLDNIKKKEIEEYTNTFGTEDDKMFYLKMKIMYLILTKYYAQDGLSKR